MKFDTLRSHSFAKNPLWSTEGCPKFLSYPRQRLNLKTTYMICRKKAGSSMRLCSQIATRMDVQCDFSTTFSKVNHDTELRENPQWDQREGKQHQTPLGLFSSAECSLLDVAGILAGQSWEPLYNTVWTTGPWGISAPQKTNGAAKTPWYSNHSSRLNHKI